MIVIAFIVGFSDRLSERVMKSLVGRFGGDRNGELVSLERLAPAVTPSALTAILVAGGKGNGAAGNLRAPIDAQRASTTSSNGLNGPSTLPTSDAPESAPPEEVSALDRPGQETRLRY
jgi:hypothetical protein